MDWAVVQCVGSKHGDGVFSPTTKRVYKSEGLRQIGVNWNPSKNWDQAGPLIEENCITVDCVEGEYSSRLRGYKTYWVADIGKQCAETVYGSQGDDWGESYQISGFSIKGDTPLIAAMRCLVQVKLGDEVEIPEEILEN